MKDDSWLINTSRGEVVETDALKNALSSGRLSGAVLDVWENEPEIDLELLSQAYISTPHIAGYSIDGKAKGTSQVVQALCLFFDLPLLDFYPTMLPEPLVPEIVIEGAGKSSFQIVYEAVMHTYPIMKDHILLQRSPSTFEQQRGQYPVRREFPSYTVRLNHGKPKAVEMLLKLGFKIK
jgi:erythronate-4-phosphate dehydrogenase